MFTESLSYLKCPRCEAELRLDRKSSCLRLRDQDVIYGKVLCTGCAQEYPVLAGALILVPEVGDYLLTHVKGISRHVEDRLLPKAYRAAFARAKRQIAVEHIEDDLEAERVTALYVMTHYLSASEVYTSSPALSATIKQYWDQGPFARIKAMFGKKGGKNRTLVELGCGVGGLLPALKGHVSGYLGLDSSFASVVLARHLALGAEPSQKVFVPDDLLAGPVTREIKVQSVEHGAKFADFIVCDLSDPPLKEGKWDATAALNVIDMLPEPGALPLLQHQLIVPGGLAIQSCPYIWHVEVADTLRKRLPPQIKASARAVEWLYQSVGFKIDSSEEHVPWIFFKNIRQIELYSVHLFFASKL